MAANWMKGRVQCKFCEGKGHMAGVDEDGWLDWADCSAPGCVAGYIVDKYKQGQFKLHMGEFLYKGALSPAGFEGVKWDE